MVECIMQSLRVLREASIEKDCPTTVQLVPGRPCLPGYRSSSRAPSMPPY
jgi:hypothetical protein